MKNIIYLLGFMVNINLEPVHDDNYEVNKVLNQVLQLQIVGPFQLLPLKK